MNLETFFHPRKSRNGVSRYFAVRRKLAKYSERYVIDGSHLIGESRVGHKLLVYFVPFVFFVDQLF